MNLDKIKERFYRAGAYRNKASPKVVENRLKHLVMNDSGTLELNLEDKHVLGALIYQVELASKLDEDCSSDSKEETQDEVSISYRIHSLTY